MSVYIARIAFWVSPSGPALQLSLRQAEYHSDVAFLATCMADGVSLKCQSVWLTAPPCELVIDPLCILNIVTIVQ